MSSEFNTFCPCHALLHTLRPIHVPQFRVMKCFNAKGNFSCSVARKAPQCWADFGSQKNLCRSFEVEERSTLKKIKYRSTANVTEKLPSPPYIAADPPLPETHQAVHALWTLLTSQITIWYIIVLYIYVQRIRRRAAVDATQEALFKLHSAYINHSTFSK